MFEAKHIDKTVGEQLAYAREQLGQDIEKISSKLRIRPDYLRALEKNDYRSLPGTTYIYGFLRNYAEYLGLDGVTMIRNIELADESQTTQLSFEPTEKSNKDRKKNRTLIKILFSLCVAILVGLVIYGDEYFWQSGTIDEVTQMMKIAPHTLLSDTNRSNTAPIPPNPEARNDDTRTYPEILTKIPEADKTIVPDANVGSINGVVAIRARSRVWMRIVTDQGWIVFDSIIRPTENFILPLADYYAITTQNAGVLDYVIDEQVTRSLGRNGQSFSNQRIIRSDIFRKQ